jgi:hypothetical protein
LKLVNRQPIAGSDDAELFLCIDMSDGLIFPAEVKIVKDCRVPCCFVEQPAPGTH